MGFIYHQYSLVELCVLLIFSPWTAICMSLPTHIHSLQLVTEYKWAELAVTLSVHGGGFACKCADL